MVEKTFRDEWKCPRCRGDVVTALRRASSVGHVVSSYCWHCRRMVKVLVRAEENPHV